MVKVPAGGDAIVLVAADAVVPLAVGEDDGPDMAQASEEWIFEHELSIFTT